VRSAECGVVMEKIDDEPRLIESGPLRYLLSLPPGQETAGLRPVLVFLHGYDEGAPMDIYRALTLHGPLRPGNPAVARQRFVIAAPQLPARGDLWLRSAGAVRQIVRQVQADYRGDPERTYLTGFSFGGNGVFDLANAQPGTWAALWAVDPTRPPARALDLPVWLSSGELSRRRRTEFMTALGRHRDRIFTDAGLDHVGTATRAYGDEQIYRWLLARSAGEP
jgi:hypothetical protein